MEASPLPGLLSKPTLISTVNPTPRPRPSPFTTHHSRRWPTAAPDYPLPCDIRELSRQALVHELFLSIYTTPHICPPPPANARILDLGCGTALWSAAMAARHPDAHITGLDIVPVYTDMSGLRFDFKQHDFNTPLPFETGSFDMVFARDVALGMPCVDMYAGVIAELVRVLRPGGVLEMHAVDNVVRCLRRQEEAAYEKGTSVYVVAPTTGFEESRNVYVKGYNERLGRGLGGLGLQPVPCTMVAPAMVGEGLVGVQGRRVAVPLDEVWWEDGGEKWESPGVEAFRKRMRRSSVHSTATGREGGVLTEQEKAVRGLARLCFVQLVEGLEVFLRKEGMMREDEWDRWYRELMWNFMEGGGLRGGECIEFGAWWGVKPA